MKTHLSEGIEQIRALPKPVRLGVAAGLWLVTVAFVAFIYDLPSAILSGTVAICAAVLMVAHKRRYPDTGVTPFLWSFIDLKRPTLSQVFWAVIGVVIIIASEFALAVAQATLLPGSGAASHDISGSVNGSPPLWTVVFLFAWVAGAGPFIEELVFRNGIQKLLSYRIRPEAAIAVTSAAFALLHVPSYGGFGAPAVALLLPVTVVFIGSMVFGVLYWRTENVVVPTLAHMGFNGIVLLYAVVNPPIFG